jgi:uncharacterized surface protein with fasciclin (FAS1) repeats
MNHVNNAPGVSPAKNLLDTAAAEGKYVTFGKAVEKASLGATLRGPGPFTVFAPTDAAFDKLPAGELEKLFKPENKDELVSLVNFHVIKGSKMAADIGKWETAKMINGQSAPVKLTDGKISIGGAHVIAADITTSNGVIHGIDKVNVPTVTKH